MPVQPTPNRINSSGQSTSLKRRFKILLVLLVAVGALLIFDYFYARQKARQEAQVDKVAAFISKFKNQTANVNIQGKLWQDRFSDYLNQAASERDPQKRFDLLFKGFEILKSAYSAGQEPKTRKLAEELKAFLAANFSDFYKEEKFSLPCLDTDCGKAQYPEEIKKIMELLPQMKFPQDVDYQKLIQNSFDRAALTNSQDDQWSAYNGARQYFWIAYQENKDPKVKEGGLMLLDYLKKNYSSQYEQAVRIYGEERFRFD